MKKTTEGWDGNDDDTIDEIGSMRTYVIFTEMLHECIDIYVTYVYKCMVIIYFYMNTVYIRLPDINVVDFFYGFSWIGQYTWESVMGNPVVFWWESHPGIKVVKVVKRSEKVFFQEILV